MTFGAVVEEFARPDSARSSLTTAQYRALDKAARNREKDGRYFLPARLRDGGRRRNADIEALYGIALDFDSGRTTEVVIRSRLEGLAYVAYSTFSSSQQEERWRVFVPYAEPIDSGKHRAVYEHFQSRFEGDVDEHCGTPCQFSYTPACLPDAVEAFKCFHCTGELFNAQAVDDPKASQERQEETPGAKGGATERLAEVVDALQFISSEDRKTWIDVGLAMKNDFGDAGLGPWLKWSASSTKFDFGEAGETWSSFSNDHKGPKVTVATIFWLAQQAGWRRNDDKVPDYIASLNERYFVAPYGGRAVIFEEGSDPVCGRKLLTMLSTTDFRTLFMNQCIDVPGKGGKRTRRSIAELWLLHAKRRQYRGVIFAPNLEIPDYYNRWTGFALTPKPGCWDRLREHIRVVICKEDPEVFEFVLNWIAFTYQFPDRQAEVAIVLKGGRGTGKGFLARVVGAPFGQHFVHISSARHLTGNFNAHLGEAVFLFVDEAFWAGDKQGEAQLKRMVTEPTLIIERKRFDSETMPNRLHIMMASNSEWVVPAGLDERRFLVLDVDNSKQQDAQYFAALEREVQEGGIQAMLHDLLQRDLTNFNHRQAPKTRALLDQKVFSFDPTQKWWFERLQAGMFDVGGEQFEWGTVPKEVVHDSYVQAEKSAGRSYRATQTELGMRLRGLLPKGYPKRVKRKLEGGPKFRVTCSHP